MRKTIVPVIVTLIFLVFALFPAAALSTESSKWAGVDEKVIEKFAKEHGREAKEPLIDKEQGDLLLFLFLLAGAVGGFVAGYTWKTLVEKTPHGKGERHSSIDSNLESMQSGEAKK